MRTKRTKILDFTASEQEAQTIKQYAARLGIPVAAYLRMSALMGVKE